MTQTPLDIAFARFEADPENETLRRAYFAAIMRSELQLLLNAEPDQTLDPVLIEDNGHTYALGFDTADRLASFTETTAPSAILAGRDALDILSPARLGLGLNLGVAASAYMLPKEALDWLVTVGKEAKIATPIGDTFALPHAEQEFLEALDMFLAGLAGQATTAHFAQLPPSTPVLMFSGHPEIAKSALTKATAEFFAILGAAPVAVMFEEDLDDPDALRGAGLTFTLPKLAETKPPGADKSKPPRLR